jgi:tetratricopeptide (TPR) repeat protein
MGVLLESRGDLKTAHDMLNLAVRLNTENGRSYYNRALVLDKMNRKEEAIRDYDMALERDPDKALQIIGNRSVLYLETGHYDKAVKDLDELIKIDKTNFTFYYNRAFSKVMLKDYEGAVADYETVLKLNPGDTATMEQLKALKKIIKVR